jgi:hypothetical protein
MPKSDQEIMHIMMKENKDIRLSLNFVGAKTAKGGGHVIMGVDTDTLNRIVMPPLLGQQPDYHVCLYAINIKEFEEIKSRSVLPQHYPGMEYQPLFDLLQSMFGKVCIQSEMDDIIRVALEISKKDILS